MPELPPLRITAAGAAFVAIGGSSYRLGMPTLGQFQHLKLRYQELSDDVADFTDQRLEAATAHARAVDALKGDRAVDELTAEERQQLRDMLRDAKTESRRFLTAQEEAWLSWWDECFTTMLGDGKRPDRDAYEPWMQNANSIGDLLVGWQFNPLARGD